MPETTQADTLREAMVGELREQGAVRTDRSLKLQHRAAAPLRAGESLEKAYANATVVTRRDEHGIAISTVSAPRIQAMMLEQAQLRPGMRVLEIGSGGYNAR